MTDMVSGLGDFPTLAEVEKLISQINDASTSKDAARAKYCEERAEDLDKKRRGPNAIDYSFYTVQIMRRIDKAFVDTVGKQNLAVGTNEDGYRSRLAVYSARIITIFDEEQPNHGMLMAAKA